MERGAWTRCAESSHPLHDESNEVLHLRFRTPVQVQEGLPQAQIRKEEEGALQVQFQVEVREEEPFPTEKVEKVEG